MSPKRIYASSACVILFFAFFLTMPQFASSETIISFDDLYEGDLVVDGFELTANTKLNIFAIGAELKSSDEMYAYAWILDAESREPVWIMEDEDTRRFKKSKHVREFEGEISLPAGKYEAYYYVGRPYNLGNVSIHIDDFDEAIKLLGSIFNDDDEDMMEYYQEHVEDLMFTVEAPEGSFAKFSPVSNIEERAIVNFNQPEDDFYEEKGFTLKKDMTLQINAIGEYFSNNRVFVDFGWIINADTREKVWKMDKWNTSWAGGGRKNRGIVDEVELPTGNYLAFFVTDDSHSFGDWNVMPPHDPLNYGMTVSVKDKNDLKNSAEYIDDYSEYAIVNLTRIRESQFKSKGFKLNKDADVHVLAAGEYGYTDEFVDYGWIENIDDDEIVWEMSEDNTEYAGGASKNRRFDGIVSLPAGSYLVYFASDDSHSYRRWNDSPPYDQKMWGIAVYGAGKGFDSNNVVTFDEAPQSSNVIASLIGIGDDEDISKEFTLDKPQRVKIFALGEGKGGDMYDYGWIEDVESGDIIWEMTYRKSRHAGGDLKNRKVDTKIYLEAGEYELFFMSDGSHSFPDFNTSRPHQAHKWGITILKTE